MDSFAAREACQEGRYNDVLAMYDKAKPDGSWTNWDYYYYAYALRKVKNYAKGREIARAGIIAFPEFTNLHGIYCWCLYYLYIKKFDERLHTFEDFRRAVDAILKYSQQGPYTPYTLAVWRMVEVLKTKPPSMANMAGDYLRRLDPDLLSDEEKKVTLRGREQVIASERERWYALMSRTLIKEEKYDDCIRLCRMALGIFPELHHDNDIWFSYRIGLCELRLGQIEDARQRFEELLKYKQHWIVYRGLFLRPKPRATVRRCAATEHRPWQLPVSLRLRSTSSPSWQEPWKIWAAMIKRLMNIISWRNSSGPNKIGKFRPSSSPRSTVMTIPRRIGRNCFAACSPSGWRKSMPVRNSIRGLSIRSFPAARPVSSGNTAAVSIISVRLPCIGSERKKGRRLLFMSKTFSI